MKKLLGDIYISIERVKENALIFDSTFKSEIARVMIHGILHLIGYNDKSKIEKETNERNGKQILKKDFMSIFNTTYDIIIVGGGHAGCESALAGAKMGKNAF